MGVGHRRYRCSKQELDWFYDEVMSREVDLQLYADQASVPQQVMSRLNVVLHADIVRAAVAIQTWWRCVVPWRQYQRLYRAVVTIQGGGRGCAGSASPPSPPRAHPHGRAHSSPAQFTRAA